MDFKELEYKLRRSFKNSKLYKGWLWINYRVNPNHRYHVLSTGRKPGYCDYDVRVNCTMLKVIIDFVEKEAYVGKDLSEIRKEIDETIKYIKEDARSGAGMNGSWVEEYEHNLEEMFELYVWAKDNFKYVSCEVYRYFCDSTKEYDYEAEKKYSEEVDMMVGRIFKLRSFLWT